MAVKDSVGGWKDNAFIFMFPNTCTVMQKVGGVEWRVYLERMGINTTDKCPIPAVNILCFKYFFYSVI